MPVLMPVPPPPTVPPAVTAPPVVAIPVKRFARAKRRLAQGLGDVQASDVARSLLAHVLAQATAAVGAGRVLVVTNDPEAAAWAARRGAAVIDSPEAEGLNGAVRAAAAWARARGAGLVLVPSDLPHLQARTLAEAASRLGPATPVLLAPARCDGGTNLFACEPADLLAPAFGPDSYARHRAAARAAGVEPAILHAPDLGIDVDRLSDLHEVFGAPGGLTPEVLTPEASAPDVMAPEILAPGILANA